MAGDTAPIVVVGGGIGGLAAALALARQGHAVHVLEQAASFGEIGAGIQLGPNVFRMFERLGLTDAIMASAVLPDALVMMDAVTGGEITRVPLGADFRACFTHPYAVIHRADLHAVVLDACRAHKAIRLETGRTVEGYVDDGTGVAVRCADGATVTGRALIGADGLWSKIRGQLVGDGPPRISGHIAYRAVLPIDQVPPDLLSDSVVLWAGPKTHLVHYKLRRGELYNLVAVFHSDRYVEGWDSAGDRDELMARFAGTRPQVQRLLDKIGTWRMWVLCDREPIRQWSRGRVTLLGDAAHPMLQYLAQGACMAMEDAVCLADRIAARGDDLAGAFTDYEDARYLRTGRVQVTARIYGEIYHAAGVTAELRTMMMAGRSPAQAHDGVAWLYGGP